jgi:hypothetical protein
MQFSVIVGLYFSASVADQSLNRVTALEMEVEMLQQQLR